MMPLNKRKEKKTAMDDGAASSSKNTTGPFHLSSQEGVSGTKAPPPPPLPLPLPFASCLPY